VSDKNKEVVLRFEEEFKNRAHLDVVYELFAPEFVHQLPFPGLPQGREGLKAVGQNLFASFPHEHLHVTVEQCLADGDFVITRTRVKAKHLGPWAGIPATGREVGWTENTLFRLKNGQIVEMMGEGNFLGVVGQLQG
jgi:predicted ester cyclase